MKPPLVVKVGGSLLDWDQLPARLEQLLLSLEGHPIVLIAGGGPAADWIRRLDRVHSLGEERSHHLAIQCLDITAQVLAFLLPMRLVVVHHPRHLASIWRQGRLPVLAPRLFLEADALSPTPLEHTWRVTSDTIAARLAHRLGDGDLVLLKSANLPPATTLKAAAHVGFVDAVFPEEARNLARVSYINLRSDGLSLTPFAMDQA